MAMYEPGMRLDSIVAMTEVDEDEYLAGLQMRLVNRKGDSNLDLIEIGLNIVDWESERKTFGNDIDRVSLVSDNGGICDVIVYDGHDGIRSTNMTKDLADCDPSYESIK